MSNYQFKVGDKVYFPKVSNKVFTLKKNTNEAYPIQIEYTDSTADSFTLKGLLHIEDENSSLILATEENRLLLNQLYGIEFDEPLSKDSIIQDSINTKGFCLCLASDSKINRLNNIKDFRYSIEVIVKIDFNSTYPYKSKNAFWVYAEPVEIKPDGTIIYLADD